MHALQTYFIIHTALGLPLLWHVYRRPPIGPNLRKYPLGWLAAFVFWPFACAWAIFKEARKIHKEARQLEADLQSLNQGNKLANDPRITEWVAKNCATNEN